MILLQYSDIMVKWEQHPNFYVAVLDEKAKTATGFTAFIKVTDVAEFWGMHMEDYLDVLCEHGCVGAVLFDIRGTQRDVPDDFVELYIKYRQFWINGIRLYTAHMLQPLLHFFDFDDVQLK